MGGTVAFQTQCCLMKREEYDEDDVSDSEREGAKEKKVQAVGALHWNERPGTLPGAPPCVSTQVPRSLSETTTVPVNLRK